jgi:serine/threonine protein kinase
MTRTVATTNKHFKRWRLQEKIGDGNQGSVWRGTAKKQRQNSDSAVAIKISERTDASEREYELMQRLEHPFIVRTIDGRVSKSKVTMVMELVDSGHLLDKLQEQPDNLMPESMARTYFMQMLSAVAYLHNVEHVVHKDIKLENVLVRGNRCMLADFGFARSYVHGKRTLRDHCASMHYAAPEIWHGLRYEGPSVDIWALGVTLYALTTGYLPFGDAGGMVSAYYHVEALRTRGLWLPDTMSTELKHLLRSCMLVYDMEKRASLDDVRAHPWIVNALALPLYRMACQHESLNVGRRQRSTSDLDCALVRNTTSSDSYFEKARRRKEARARQRRRRHDDDIE